MTWDQHGSKTHKLQTHWVQEMGNNGVGIWTFPLIASRQRVQQEQLQPTPQRSNICFSVLENQSIRNKMGLTPKHCHTAFSMMWPRKRQFLKQSVIHGTGKASWHQMTPEHHLTTGSADAGPSGTSPLLVLVSSSFSVFSWFSSAAVLSALKKILALLSEK